MNAIGETWVSLIVTRIAISLQGPLQKWKESSALAASVTEAEYCNQ